jgi:hypothetical protein
MSGLECFLSFRAACAPLGIAVSDTARATRGALCAADAAGASLRRVIALRLRQVAAAGAAHELDVSYTAGSAGARRSARSRRGPLSGDRVDMEGGTAREREGREGGRESR